MSDQAMLRHLQSGKKAAKKLDESNKKNKKVNEDDHNGIVHKLMQLFTSPAYRPEAHTVDSWLFGGGPMNQRVVEFDILDNIMKYHGYNKDRSDISELLKVLKKLGLTASQIEYLDDNLG